MNSLPGLFVWVPSLQNIGATLPQSRRLEKMSIVSPLSGDMHLRMLQRPQSTGR